MSECGCDTAQKGQALHSIENALDLMLQQARPVGGTEIVPLSNALGRILAEPVCSQVNVPPWDNSAMDGYAVKYADLQGEMPKLRVSQRIPAGAAGTELKPATAARIFTGAPVPPGADTVAIQEACRLEGDYLIIEKYPTKGANIRLAGEDIGAGDEILSAGIRLQPQHLGLCASVGVEELPVVRRLRVAVFSSGDELVSPGEPLGPGQIYNSNQYTLAGLLQALGCEVVQVGILEDSFEATCDALTGAAERSDLVITSGGVSVGEEDHVKPAVEKLGSLDLWKIAIRPGKPLAFGHIGETPFIGTPGNPVSLFVTFCIFARPFILKCQGLTGSLTPLQLTLKADFDWSKPDRRREYARARTHLNKSGELLVTLFPSRSSGVMSSVAWADGLAVIPEGKTLMRGDAVSFIPFNELIS